jgi:hypothetical protein
VNCGFISNKNSTVIELGTCSVNVVSVVSKILEN